MKILVFIIFAIFFGSAEPFLLIPFGIFWLISSLDGSNSNSKNGGFYRGSSNNHYSGCGGGYDSGSSCGSSCGSSGGGGAGCGGGGCGGGGCGGC